MKAMSRPNGLGWIRWGRVGVVWVWVCVWVLGVVGVQAAERSGAPDGREVRRMFVRPSAGYSSGPLWVWNDRLTEGQVRGTLEDLAGQGVRQVWVHPRPGLMTPYLGRDWFQAWEWTLEEAGRRDMKVWIYDENSYPSGFAGGLVMDRMPSARGMGLGFEEVNTPPVSGTDVVAVYRGSDAGWTAVTGGSGSGSGSGTGEVEVEVGGSRYLVARVLWAKDSPWHGKGSYVNLLTPGVTEAFLEVTMGAYDRQVAGEYGKRIPGVFTDEPNIRPAGGFPWCPDLPEQFERDWGYALLPVLPSLARETGDWRAVRHHYFSTLNRLFIERWAKPYFEACEARGLESTGHYWDHEWPDCLGVPDNMAMAAWQHRPGIDCLMNQYAEHTHAQFGNVRYAREVASVANQMGRERTLVEVYGAAGWDLRMVDMKRIADWLLVLGINTMNEHLSYVTLRGARKRDHPLSFSYHQPWWSAYHVHAGYMARLSAALSQGRQVNRVLVLQPTTTAWMYQGNGEKLNELGRSFSGMLMQLEAAQIGYDLGSEDMLRRQGGLGRAVGGRPGWSVATTLRIGRQGYDTVVIPPGTENLDGSTWSRLREFAAAGGRILSASEPPLRVDGRLREPEAERVEAVWRRGWKRMEPEALVALLQEDATHGNVVVRREAGDGGTLFHHRRVLADGELLFLANIHPEARSKGLVTGRYRGLERWDPYTGEVEAYPGRATASGLVTEFDLPPAGSLLLHLSEKAGELQVSREGPPRAVPAKGPVAVQRLGMNVLTLDFVDLTAGGEVRRGMYAPQANRRVWQVHGLDRNPWDSAVQFGAELVSRSFPVGSGFEVSYRFTVEGSVPEDLEIVVERPDLYGIECNGERVTTRRSPRLRPTSAMEGGPGVPEVDFGEDGWWLDRAFGRVPLGKVARVGENVVTLRAAPMTMWHEVESAYVRGSFALRPAEKGWVIVPETGVVVGEQGWNEQGAPFYADGYRYEQEFTVSDVRGRFEVVLPQWRGAVARVEVNGREAGWLMGSGDACDVTSRVRRGSNRVAITVVGTLKNTLGPHHAGPGLGSAWPGMFQQGPADGPPPGVKYATVGYGLMAGPELRQVETR